MDSLKFVSGERYFTPPEAVVVEDPACKKIKSESPAAADSQDRLLKIEEELITIHGKLEELSAANGGGKKPARKNTLSELNLKLSAILDILSTQQSDGKILFEY